jgi:hypothetical protein
MSHTSHHARITAPLPYLATGGHQHHIPTGPCLVEHLGGQAMDVIWGAQGQNSAVLSLAQIVAARDGGQLVLLD